MAVFTLTDNAGQKFDIESDTIENAQLAFDHAFGAKPPPGVIIHEPTRSYVTGAQGEPTLSVDTTGMAPGTMSKSKDFNLSDFIIDKAGALMGRGGARPDPGGPTIGSVYGPDNAAALPPLDPRLPDRNTAAAALAMRRDSTPFSIAARPAPFIQGLSAGYGDELLSGTAAAGSGARQGYEAVREALGGTPAARVPGVADTYGVMQEAQRQELAQDRAEYPKTAGALQVGGVLANLSALSRLGVPLGAPEGASMATRMGVGGLLGGIMGGAEGFGSGSGLEDRLQQAKQGGIIGAGAGAALQPIASMLGSAATRGMDWLGVRPYLEALGVARPAATAVNRALEADDAYTGAGARNIARAGPDAMAADAGPTATGLLDTALQKGGAGSRIVREMVDRRAEGANQTLSDTFDTVLGQQRGLGTMTADINQAGRAGRRTAYDTAYSTPIDYSAPAASDLQQLLQRVPGDVVATANRLMQLGGHQSQQIRATVGADGNVVFDSLPDVRQIDYITRAMRQLSEAGETTGALGRATPMSQAYTNLAGDIRRTTRDLVPEYGTALDTAADDIGRIQATRLGNDILSPAMTRDEVRIALNNHQASAAEMDAVRLGVRQHIFDQMDKVRRIATDPNVDARQAAAALKDLSSDAANAKLDMVITDPLQRQQIKQQIEQATAAIQLRANVVQNSKTFARTVQNETNQAMLEPGPAGQMMRGRPWMSAQRAISAFTGRTPEYDIGRSDVMNQQIAELLTSANPQRQLGLLQQAFTASPQNAAFGRDVGGIGGLLLGVPGYQTARDYFRGK